MYDEDLNALEDGIRRLKVEYEIFFNGNRKRPPEDLRMRMEKLVKRLSEASGMSYSQRFRYNTLVTRLYVFRDLWRRTTSEREAGQPRPETNDAAKAHAVLAGATSSDTVQICIEDPSAEGQKIRHLYEAVIRMTGKHTEEAAAFTYQQFARYVANQTQTIQDKYGCTSVRFTVSLEGDTLKFKARADKPG
jgi:hypothetical protein